MALCVWIGCIVVGCCYAADHTHIDAVHWFVLAERQCNMNVKMFATHNTCVSISFSQSGQKHVSRWTHGQPIQFSVIIAPIEVRKSENECSWLVQWKVFKINMIVNIFANDDDCQRFKFEQQPSLSLIIWKREQKMIWSVIEMPLGGIIYKLINNIIQYIIVVIILCAHAYVDAFEIAEFQTWNAKLSKNEIHK